VAELAADFIGRDEEKDQGYVVVPFDEEYYANFLDELRGARSKISSVEYWKEFLERGK